MTLCVRLPYHITKAEFRQDELGSYAELICSYPQACPFCKQETTDFIQRHGRTRCRVCDARYVRGRA